MNRLDYYNDFEPTAAAWLNTLIENNAIPTGAVDARSILDVRADELSGFRRCHFFAGIGGWAEALRLAGVPDWLPLWTGSPPCQPFSAAGKRKGRDDDRHLGPKLVDLVRVARPPLLFGEQVASSEAVGSAARQGKQGVGKEPAWAWWDDLSVRLEAAGYASWAGIVPAAGVGAPHIRQRLFFAAVDLRFADPLEHATRDGREQRRSEPSGRCAASGCVSGELADANDTGLEGWRQPGCECSDERAAGACGVAGELADNGMQQRPRGARDSDVARGRQQEPTAVAGLHGAGGLADPNSTGRLPRTQRGLHRGQEGAGPRDVEPQRQCDAGERSCSTNGFWSSADWLGCRDGRWRPVEPGTFPLAHGVSGRVGLLRGYGNAIVPQAAAAFIESTKEVLTETGIWAVLEDEYK